jgi:hypothetical protein
MEFPMTSSPANGELVAKEATPLQGTGIVVSMLFMIARNRDCAPDPPTIGPARLIAVAPIAATLVIAGPVVLATLAAR